MQTVKRASTLAAVLLALTAASGAAQQAENSRQGFFAGFGMGYGSLDVTCDLCNTDREGGVSGYLKLGTAVRPNLLLGVETNGWFRSQDIVSVRLTHITGAAYWYPKAESGFYLKGGVGLSSLRTAVDGLGSDTESGLGVLTGLGYDWPVSPNVSVAPTANFFWGKLDGGAVNVLQLGLGVNFR